MGELTHTVFCRDEDCSPEERLHPRAYSAKELGSPGFLAELRTQVDMDVECDVEHAIATAAELLKPVGETVGHLHLPSG
jgi:hypothetical protein